MSYKKQHFSPIFANKEWAIDNHFLCYNGKLKNKYEQGYTKWGVVSRQWNKSVEEKLNTKIENDAAKIYRKLILGEDINKEERKVWSQFLLSQLVRTPTFIRYETESIKLTNTKVATLPDNRVGCRNCLDLLFLSERDWCLLIPEKDDDYFIRTDNPILQTGFIEQRESVLYYPITPKICFVACSMKKDWDPLVKEKKLQQYVNYVICTKLHMSLLNFYFVRSAADSIIMHPSLKSQNLEKIIMDPLLFGEYPQPPFPLHLAYNENIYDLYNSIQCIMSEIDGKKYYKWQVEEIKHFYLAN